LVSIRGTRADKQTKSIDTDMSYLFKSIGGMMEEQEKQQEYKGESRTGKKEDGYILMEKGKKIRKWVDKDGKWREEELT
jgi:hypothetical protein